MTLWGQAAFVVVSPMRLGLWLSVQGASTWHRADPQRVFAKGKDEPREGQSHWRAFGDRRHWGPCFRSLVVQHGWTQGENIPQPTSVQNTEGLMTHKGLKG